MSDATFEELITAAQSAIEAGEGLVASPLAEQAYVLAQASSNPVREASALCLWGIALDLSGHAQQAEEKLGKAAKLDEETFGKGHPAVCRDRHNIGMCLLSQGRPADAAIQFEEVVSSGAAAIDISRALGPLATAYLGAEMLRQSESAHMQWVNQAKEAYGATDPRTLTAYNGLGESLRRMNRRNEAYTVYSEIFRAMRTVKRPSNAQTEQVACATHNLAIILSPSEPVRAQELLAQAQSSFQTIFGPSHPYIARTKYWTGLILLDRGEKDKAAVLWREAREMVGENDFLAREIDARLSAS